MTNILRILKQAMILVAWISWAGTLYASYPTQAVTIVSPYGPGGAADLAARTLSATATGLLGSEIIVINRTGAAGVTGSTYVARAKPNGYTLLLSRVGSQAAVPAINRKIPYKWDDFTFLGLLEKNPFVLCVNSNSPYKTFDDLKAAVKNGKKLSYSSAGIGTLLHLAMVIVADDMGVEQSALRHIPFKGGGKAVAAVLGGHVDIIFQNLSGVLGNIQAGKLRPLLVTTKSRPPSIPNVPTASEIGHPNLEVIVGWSGLWGPQGLPQEVTGKWQNVLQGLKQDKEWNKLTKELGSVPDIMNPTDTKAFVKVQYEKFKEVTERLGLTIQ